MAFVFWRDMPPCECAPFARLCACSPARPGPPRRPFTMDSTHEVPTVERLWPRSPPAFLPVLYRIRIGTLLVDTFPGRPTVSAHTQKHFQIRQVPSKAHAHGDNQIDALGGATHKPTRCASPRAKRLSSTMGMIMTCVSCRRRRHGCGACGFFLRSSSLRRLC